MNSIFLYNLFLSLHIISVIAWMAGLLYLPRLFVYHAMSKDKISLERFVIMERKLFYGIMTPGGIITIILGFWLLDYGYSGLWLNIKLLLVLLLVIYHGYCFKYLMDFKHNRNKHSHIFFRWFNEVPVILLIAIILLVELKPL